MRTSRIKAESVGFYHTISRIVDRTFRFTAAEKHIFVKMMYQIVEFSGVELVSFCVMCNHFHLLIRVDPDQEVDDIELERRLRCLYQDMEVDAIISRWEEWRKLDMEYLVEEDQAKYLRRMGDLSEFMKTLKQRYSISYNSRHDRRGTLWEERFKSILIEPSEKALSVIAAYIDLNPVRAKVVTDPKDYQWSGYGEATRGLKRARQGLSIIYQQGDEGDASELSWDSVAERYRTWLYLPYEQSDGKDGTYELQADFSREDAERIIAEGGVLTLAQVLLCRVTYFSRGLALGSAEYIECIYQKQRDKFSSKRRSGARPMRHAKWEGLCTLRASRGETVTV